MNIILQSIHQARSCLGTVKIRKSDNPHRIKAHLKYVLTRFRYKQRMFAIIIWRLLRDVMIALSLDPSPPCYRTHCRAGWWGRCWWRGRPCPCRGCRTGSCSSGQAIWASCDPSLPSRQPSIRSWYKCLLMNECFVLCIYIYLRLRWRLHIIRIWEGIPEIHLMGPNLQARMQPQM